MLIRMALRNLTRRPIQSLLASGAVAAGLATCVWMTNFQDGTWISMIDDTLRASAGHVVVQPDGYQDSRDSALMLQDSGAIAARLQQLAPDGVVLRRSFLDGLLASSDNTVGVAVNAVEPALEREVSQLPNKLVEGEWLSGEREVVIGVGLAKKLGVAVGGEVALTLAADGGVTGPPFEVAGIFTTGGAQMDNFFALAPLHAVQGLLPERRDPATAVALQLPSTEAPDDLIERARAAVAGPGREVLTFEEAMPEVVAAAQLDKQFTMVIWAILGAIVSVGVLNLLLMSLFQRTREMGVMLAVGMRPADVRRLVLVEGAILGLAGVVVGWTAGQLLSIPMVRTGIDLAAFQDSAPAANVALDTVVRAQFIWDKDLAWAVWFVLLVVLGSLWPAVRAGRLEPVEALRHV